MPDQKESDKPKEQGKEQKKEKLKDMHENEQFSARQKSKRFFSEIKVIDTNSIIMIICLAFIFSLTILNKTGLLTNWILYVLLVVFLAIMFFFLMRSIKKNKEIKEEIIKNVCHSTL